MKSAAIALLVLSFSVLAASRSFHRRSADLSKRKTGTPIFASLPGPGGNGIGVTVVGGSVIDGSGTLANSQTGAAAVGQASFQPALAGNTTTSASNTTTQTGGDTNTPANSPNNGTGSNNGSGSQNGGNNNGDPNLTVLNFALTLENLEAEFYQQALLQLTPKVMQKAGLSDFQAKAISQQIAQQVTDEQTHVQILQQTIQQLGGTPFAGCSFNFDRVLADPVTFLSTARSLEAAGVGAYIGGASLVTNPSILNAATSILVVEGRHQAALNVFSGGSLSPQAFDIGMSPEQVLALAGGFFNGCKASDLGLTANQPLSVIDGLTQSTLFTTGSVLQFQTSAQTDNLNPNSLSCQMMTGGATTAIVMPASNCVIPPKINGPVAVFLTSDANPLSGNLATQKTENVVAGPALLFVDTQKDEELQKVFAIKNLGTKSLPSANLGFLALQPQNGQNNTQQGENQQDKGNGKGNKTGGADKVGGFNKAFMSVSFGSIPSSVVQSNVQLKDVNGGQGVNGGIGGATVLGWLPKNNPNTSMTTTKRWKADRL